MEKTTTIQKTRSLPAFRILLTIGSVLSVVAVIYASWQSALVAAFFIHWTLSLLPHTLFHHRYATHEQYQFSRPKFWERVSYIVSFVLQGPSYLSAVAYAILHRLHHWYADTIKDPHSPTFSPHLISMMWKTRIIYNSICSVLYGRTRERNLAYRQLRKFHITPEDIAKAQVSYIPRWDSFDRLANSGYARLLWVAVYTYLYVFVFLPHYGYSYWYSPLVMLHLIMAPAQGAVINWFAHLLGPRNYNTPDTSRNLFGELDLLMQGEGLHNNHHSNAKSANFALGGIGDAGYWVLKLLSKLGVVILKKTPN